MVAAATAPDLDQSVINVGSGEETSVRQVVKHVLDLTGNKAEALYTPRNDPGVSRMWADISLAKKKLGYKPRVKLEDGLKRTLKEDKRFSAK